MKTGQVNVHDVTIARTKTNTYMYNSTKHTEQQDVKTFKIN